MCLLAVFLKRPDLQTIQKIGQVNRDGFGLGFYNKDKKCEYYKGIKTVEEIWELTKDIPIPFVFHARLASQGGKDLLLTHPFEITEQSELKLSGECDKLLFHNGHSNLFDNYALAADVDIKEVGPMSDTRAFAMICSKHRDNGYKFLKSLNNKFVIMDAKAGKFQLVGEFIHDEEAGAYYSNTFWKYRNTTGCTYAQYHNDAWDYEGGNYYAGVGNHNNSSKAIDLSWFSKLSKRAKKKLFKTFKSQKEAKKTIEELKSQNSNELKDDNQKLQDKNTYNGKELCFNCNCELPESRVTILDNLNLKNDERLCYYCERIFEHGHTEEDRLDKRIHEQPQSNFQTEINGKPMGDETKKILGLSLNVPSCPED